MAVAVKVTAVALILGWETPYVPGEGRHKRKKNHGDPRREHGESLLNHRTAKVGNPKTIRCFVGG